MKSIVIGASAGLGRAIAEVLAARGHDLFLVASTEKDLAAVAADLAIRFDVQVGLHAIDLADADPAVLQSKVTKTLGAPDNLFYVAGVSFTEDRGAIPDDVAMRLLAVNFTAGVRIVNGFLDTLADNPAANIVGIGSVAACRGRRGNSVYGSAKRGLEFYFETLRHYLAPHACRVQFYRLGYLHTRMTLGQKLPFPAMQPEDAARKICDNLGRDSGAVHLPRWWFGITSLLRMLPWVIFRKLDI